MGSHTRVPCFSRCFKDEIDASNVPAANIEACRVLKDSMGEDFSEEVTESARACSYFLSKH